MSRKTRRKKIPFKDTLPKPKAEPPKEEPEPLVHDALVAPDIPKPTPAQDVLLAILKKAPVLPWKIDVTYINGDFRKEYVALLRNLVDMLALPYTVDQAGKLTAK